MNKAFSLLTVKSVNDERREISGIASTPTVDRMGDIVEPMGARFKTPMPLLLYHDSERPVGTVDFAKPTKSGIPFRASLPNISEPGTLKDRVDEAWQSLKHKLIGAVSIGFKPMPDGYEVMKGGGYRFTDWEWLELSLVAIPAQPDAVITGVKSFDSQLRGLLAQTSKQPPGVPGIQSKPPKGGFFMPGANQVKTVKELREAREMKAARMGELVASFKDESHETTEDEQTEFDTLASEIKGLDNEIRVRSYDEMTAKPVDARPTFEKKAPTVFARNQDPDDKFKGQSFTRIQIAKALAFARNENPAAIAQQRWGKSNPKLVEFIRAAVAGGGTGSGEWGAELAQNDLRYTGDFIEYLYGMTVFDKLGLREVPAKVRIKGQDGAFTANWVGESKPIPMSKGDYSQVDLDPLKVAALTVISMELLEDSSPAAEQLVNDGLAQASSQKVDTTFLSAAAASAGVSPAGILNGVSAINASGTDLAASRADMQALLYPFVQNKMATGITLVMNPATAMALSFMYGSLDQRAYPDINQTGGVLNGLPVVVGDNVTPGQIIAIRTGDIWRIGDSGLRISMSREATIEQTDNPTGATDTPVGATTTYLTSMFQEESIAFKVVRRINFQKRRATAVQYLDNVEYGGVVS